MNARVVFVAAVAVLFHVSAGRGFPVDSQNEEQLDGGDGTGMKRVPQEGDVSNHDLDGGNLVLIEESAGNDLHDIRRREARSKKRPRKRQGESAEGPGPDQTHDLEKKGFIQEISDFLEPKKDLIINFMKPILDRIKHKPNKPSHGSSADSSISPTPPTPSDSDASTPFDSDTSTPYDSEVSNPSDSDASAAPNYPANIFSPFSLSSTKCGANEGHRSVDTLSLLFPNLNKREQPFVFVPLTNTLMRVVEQQIVGESQLRGNSKRKLSN